MSDGIFFTHEAGRKIARAVRDVEAGRLSEDGQSRGRGQATPPGALFACYVWQDGGTTDGDATTQCDRTYTARTLEAHSFNKSGDAVTAIEAGLLLGEGLEPAKRRPLTGQLDCPATDGDGEIGVGYFGLDGVFVLWDANERLHTTAC